MFPAFSLLVISVEDACCVVGLVSPGYLHGLASQFFMKYAFSTSLTLRFHFLASSRSFVSSLMYLSGVRYLGLNPNTS